MLVQRYRETGSPIELEALAAEVGEPVEAIFSKLGRERKRDRMDALTPEDALRLVRLYGAGMIFDVELKPMLSKYENTRAAINAIETKV